MGGLYTDSINAMKESFGGERVTYYAYYKYYNKLYKLATRISTLFQSMES